MQSQKLFARLEMPKSSISTEEILRILLNLKENRFDKKCIYVLLLLSFFCLIGYCKRCGFFLAIYYSNEIFVEVIKILVFNKNLCILSD